MRLAVVSLAAIALAACSGANDTSAQAQTASPGNVAAPAAAAPTSGKPFVTTVVATFDSPWAMTFLPGGRMLVTEKRGKLKLVSADGTRSIDVSGVPQVDSAGQGALKDIVLHPQFATNNMVYFSYSEAGEGGKGVVLARAKLVADAGDTARLENVETLLRGDKVEGNGHYSGRIAFAPDGLLFFTVGERQKFDPAQDKSMLLGKVLRLTADGKPAPNNPLAAQGFRPEVWSYGHRNLLGIAFDAAGNLWEQEMGPKGGDELNLILPSRNYGYPIVSNGDHYDGRPIPDHAPGDGFEAPKVFWNPVISPGGLMIYTGDLFPDWKGDAFIGGLSSEALIRVALDGTSAAKANQWPMGARIREVEQGPDGAVYVLEDEGRLLKLTPVT